MLLLQVLEVTQCLLNLRRSRHGSVLDQRQVAAHRAIGTRCEPFPI